MGKKAESKRPSIIGIILSVLIGSGAVGVFVLYVLKHQNEYKATDFIVPFLTIGLFAAVLILAVPRLLSLLSGREEFPIAEKKKPYLTMLAVMFFALILHALTMLVGVLIYSRLRPELSLASAFRQAWMKSNTDAGHYINIAENWYVKEGHDNLLIVFFPMFPLLIRALNLLTRDSFLSALIINTAATMLSSGMAYVTLRDILGEKRAVKAVFIALLVPGAIFMNSPMSEPLFLFFTLTAFFLMQRKRFVLSGVFVALAGFTRSLGVLTAVPLALTGLNEIISRIRARKEWTRLLVYLVLALFISTFGTLAYLYINYSIHGDPFKFFEYQWSNWYQKACPFYDTTRYIFSYSLDYLGRDVPGFLSLWLPQLIAIFGSLIIMAWAAKRLPASYTVYFLCYFAVAIGCTWLLSSVRYLSACVPLIAALGLMCDKRWKTAVMFPALAVLYVLYVYMYMKQMGVY